MTKLLEKAVEAVLRLSPEEQDEIARAMLALAGADDGADEIDPRHMVDVMQGMAQAQRREFATEAEIAATLRLFGS